MDYQRIIELNKDRINKLVKLGILRIEETSCQDSNVGESNYSEHIIQPWHIWQEYNLNGFDADIIKRTLRTKSTDPREMDYKKIIHICQERLRQLQY